MTLRRRSSDAVVRLAMRRIVARGLPICVAAIALATFLGATEDIHHWITSVVRGFDSRPVLSAELLTPLSQRGSRFDLHLSLRNGGTADVVIDSVTVRLVDYSALPTLRQEIPTSWSALSITPERGSASALDQRLLLHPRELHDLIVELEPMEIASCDLAVTVVYRTPDSSEKSRHRIEGLAFQKEIPARGRDFVLGSPNAELSLLFFGNALEDLPGVDAEFAAIADAILSSFDLRRVNARFLSGRAATESRLMAILAECTYDMVYYSGHSFEEGARIPLAGSDLSLGHLAEVFEANPPFLLVLNACESTGSGFHEHLHDLMIHGPTVIVGSTAPLHDAGAGGALADFVIHLYSGSSLGAALLEAKRQWHPVLKFHQVLGDPLLPFPDLRRSDAKARGESVSSRSGQEGRSRL